MVWEYQCPLEECTFSSSENEKDDIVANAKQHMCDEHGKTSTRDEVEEDIIGPG